MDGVQSQQHEDFVTSQWVEMGPIHHQQQAPQVHQHSHHDFGSYGFVDQALPSPMDPDQFRIPHAQGTVGTGYLSISSQWDGLVPSAANGSNPYLPSTAMTHSQPIPSTHLPPAQVASATITANQPPTAHSVNPSPRRTLTDSDRRRMCLFHEENPNVKQTEIGAMFGVERSTVSKVLRQKEKYLYPDDGSRSPVKRSKGKFPDIERALSVWAKNASKKGVGLTDKMIWERARLFATSTGISESHFKANSHGWLEKFKLKNNLVGIKAEGSDGIMNRARSVSSVDLMASPMAPSQSQDSHYTATQHDSPESYLEWQGGGNYKHEVGTPSSPFFSPDGHRLDSSRPSPIFPVQHARINMSTPQVRPRSQTFPLLSMDPTYISPPSSSEPLTPKIAPHLGTPVIDPALSNQSGINGNTSLSSPHPTPPAAPGKPAPSKDEAGKAMEVVMRYLRSQQSALRFGPNEYPCLSKICSHLGLDGLQLNHTQTVELPSNTANDSP